MSDPRPHPPRTLGQALQGFADALRDERRQGLSNVSAQQIARVQALIEAAEREPTVASAPSPAPPAPSKAPAERVHSKAENSVNTGAPTAANPVDLPWMIDEDAQDPETSRHKTIAAPAEGTKSDRLESIRAELGDCTRCGLCESREQIVFGHGDPDARLMLIGEAPSRQDDAAGKLFTDDAGELLTKMLQAMGLERDAVYMSAILKCRPPDNRAGTDDEIAACTPFLRAQIDVVAPEVILALGTEASRFLCGADFRFAQNRGTWKTYRGIRVMPTWHPAHLLAQPAHKRDAWQDLQKVMKVLALSGA